MRLNKKSLFLKTNKGFTIVELLIVIIVIAILATITIVSYNGITKQAVQASMKSDLRNAVAQVEAMKIENGAYPADGSSLKASPNNQLSYSLSDGVFCVAVSSSKIDSKYKIDSTSGQIVEGGDCAPRITQVSSGQYHTCGIASGRAYCWGYNGYGQLGDGTQTDRASPVAVDASGVLAGKTVTAISAGTTHTCAIASGQAYCWGDGAFGKLGDGTSTYHRVPVAVDASDVLAGKTVTSISVGDQHTCAIASGQAYCWGHNDSGQLGDSTATSERLAPVAVDASGVLAGKTVTAISAGGIHTCAIASTQAYCWGSNNSGQIGDGAASTNRLVPVAVDASGVLAGKTVTAISAGSSNYTCAIAAGQAYCWGYNYYGNIGDGTITSRSRPVAVDASGVLAGKTVTSITGSSHTCAIASGQAYCWGNNGSGQLGDGTSTRRLKPVAVDTNGPLASKTVSLISTGEGSACAIASGQAYCWGGNTYGQLGDGTKASPRLVPIPVLVPSLL